MNDPVGRNYMQCTRSAPSALQDILSDAKTMEFEMSCDASTGALLGTLAASKSSGRFLEIGCGAGAATSWILSAMDAQSTLLTIDNDEAVMEIAQRHLGGDARVQFLLTNVEIEGRRDSEGVRSRPTPALVWRETLGYKPPDSGRQLPRTH